MGKGFRNPLKETMRADDETSANKTTEPATNARSLPAVERGNAVGASVITSVSSAPINILIVDDELKNLTVLESILDDPGYRLVRADSAEKALLALLTDEFALLILDIRMPGMTGFELAQIIKQRKKSARVPIIFLTAYYNEDQHVVEGYGIGAVDYLHKPVNANILRAKVAIFAELHRKQRDVDVMNHAMLAEVSARRRAEDQLRELNQTLEQRVLERTEHVRQLMKELDHRAKNILSVVQAVARQTAATGLDNFTQRFSERIQSLAASHDLLVKSQWQGIDMFDLLRGQLAHFGKIGSRVALHGEPLTLVSSAAQVLGMTVHELATNACKHGALSNDTGNVEVCWSVIGEVLLMTWTETGGPAVAPPKRRGMGSTVIEAAAALSLGGQVKLEFAPSGVSWRLECPIANAKNILITDTDGQSGRRAGP